MEVFDDTFVPAGLRDVSFAARGCPACLGTARVPMRTSSEAHWLCDECGNCWRVDRGVLRGVDPLSCHVCATRPKSEYISAMQRTFPRFGAGAATDDGDET